MRCNMMYLKSILLYILSLFFIYILLRFIFSHKEGLPGEDGANVIANNQPTSVDDVSGVISSESILAEQAVTDRLREFANNLDAVLAEQNNHNNSDSDIRNESDVLDAVRQNIENNPYTPISSVGSSVFIKGSEKDKYRKIVVRNMS